MPRRNRPFSRNPLFRNMERAARKKLENSEAGRMLTRANQYASRSGGRRHSWRAIKRKMFQDLTRKLGPLGDLFKAMIRPSGRQIASEDKELLAASNLMEEFGSRASISPRDKDRAKAELQQTLEQQGFTTSPPAPPGGSRAAPGRGGRRRPGAGVTFEEFEGPAPPRVPSNYIEVKVGASTRRFKQSDPLITGAMIPVTSSNVHSIGYEFNWDNPANGSLKVRFLQDKGGGKKSGPGPLYYYFGVHPDLFLKFRLAASKGVWVWDNLRVRGTVSGHQYHYELKGVTGGQVPRKATRFGQNEYFLKRSMRARNLKTGEVKTLESKRPDQFVRRLPNRGRPNRGR